MNGHFSARGIAPFILAYAENGTQDLSFRSRVLNPYATTTAEP